MNVFIVCGTFRMSTRILLVNIHRHPRHPVEHTHNRPVDPLHCLKECRREFDYLWTANESVEKNNTHDIIAHSMTSYRDHTHLQYGLHDGDSLSRAWRAKQDVGGGAALCPQDTKDGSLLSGGSDIGSGVTLPLTDTHTLPLTLPATPTLNIHTYP